MRSAALHKYVIMGIMTHNTTTNLRLVEATRGTFIKKNAHIRLEFNFHFRKESCNMKSDKKQSTIHNTFLL